MLEEEMNKILPYVNRFRFEFTTESKEEVINVIENAKKVLGNQAHNFSLGKQTKGYYKRSIM